MPDVHPISVAELRKLLSDRPANDEVWVATPRGAWPVIMATNGGTDTTGCRDMTCLIAAPPAGNRLPPNATVAVIAEENAKAQALARDNAYVIARQNEELIDLRMQLRRSNRQSEQARIAELRDDQAGDADGDAQASS